MKTQLVEKEGTEPFPYTRQRGVSRTVKNLKSSKQTECLSRKDTRFLIHIKISNKLKKNKNPILVVREQKKKKNI